MSEGLEALNKIKEEMVYQLQIRGECVVNDNFHVIEEELKELENYKKAEEKLIVVDEELKTLEGIKKWINDNRKVKGFSTQLENEFRLIELALKDYGYLQVSFDRWVDRCLELEKLLKHERELNDNLITRKLKAFEIIKECFVSEFKLFEKDGEYFILFYFDEVHELTFKLKNKEEYDLLKGVLS